MLEYRSEIGHRPPYLFKKIFGNSKLKSACKGKNVLVYKLLGATARWHEDETSEIFTALSLDDIKKMQAENATLFRL